MRVLVADDEPIARCGLADLVRAHPDVELVGEAQGGREAIALIDRTHPDIVVLDVQMPAIDGFAVVATLPSVERPELVFVTAHEDFALRGFQVNAVDYVLKPYSAARLHEALSRAVERRRERLAAQHYARVIDIIETSDSSERAANAPSFAERVLVNVGTRSVVVPISAIKLLQADGACVRVRTPTTSYTLRESLQVFERRLDPRAFVRAHRSAIVRLDAVRSVERVAGDRITLVLDGGLKVPVSRGRRDAVLSALTDIRG